jgi:short-subunit dehydrogenase
MGAYSASKAGVISLSETLRGELALAGSAVTVSVVCPAFFPTGLMETARAPAGDKALATKWMQRSAQSADDVAARIYHDVQRGEFLILPTDGVRSRWRVKRFAPNLFFRKVVAMLRQQGIKP